MKIQIATLFGVALCNQLGCCLAFVPNGALLPTRFQLSSSSSSKPLYSTYDVDTDEDAEQYIGENSIDDYEANGEVTSSEPINGSSTTKGRYDDLLANVGLEGKLKQVQDLPKERSVSSYEIFCNRELKVSSLKAIGFDMDYTLAQYKQPAFDKLAFDGAKEKLVKKLGYPEAVLDFEYDHEVSVVWVHLHSKNLY